MKLCPHNKQKSKCYECGGSELCIHRVIRTKCKQCSNICLKHRKRNCTECFLYSILNNDC